MGQRHSYIKKVNFEDIKQIIRNPNKFILINTLKADNQECLISNTIDIKKEEAIINNCLKYKKNVKIVLYGKNSNEVSLFKKYEQLVNLGFTNVYLYPGGLFEWLCLQDIYGYEEFPTTTKELDILKFKPESGLENMLLLEN
jgi:rhodanese-related sulfurtransferase